MKKPSLSATQLDTIFLQSKAELNIPAIMIASSQVFISLREAEKFLSREGIKKAIGQGKIRLYEDMKGLKRTRKNQSYKCCLWDVLKTANIK